MTTRAKLASDVVSYVADNTELGEGERFDGLLRVAEAKIKRKVRVREQEKRITLQLVSEATNLPDDFLRIRSFTLDSQNYRGMDYYPPEEFRKSPTYVNQSAFATGQPTSYTIEANQVLVAPAPTQESPTTAHLTYVAFLDSLVGGAGTATNWLLEQAYDCYLFGTLLAAAISLEDPTQTQIYEAEFEKSVNEINMSENRARFPRGPGVRRIGHPHEIV